MKPAERRPGANWGGAQNAKQSFAPGLHLLAVASVNGELFGALQIGYVAMRIERSFAAARAAVARLDEEAMRRKRPLTRTFAAEILRVAEP